MAKQGYDIEKMREKQSEAIDAGIYLREGVIPRDCTVEKVRYIADMLSKGKSDSNCRKYITKELKVNDDRTIESYMAAAYRLLTPANWNEEKERLVAKNIQTLQTIIDKTMDKENYRLAKEAIDSLNRMLGLGSGNSIMIAKDNQGNEAIQINFD